jgi:hypothetical protein
MTRDDLRKWGKACVPVHEIPSYACAVLKIDLRHSESHPLFAT